MPKSILVVEDEPSLCNALCKMLIKANFEVNRATDGREGLDLALKNHPDLILLDLMMPVMDGITMLGELKKDKWGKDALVFVLTNSDDVYKATEAVTAGAYAYFIKSNWELSDVVDKIKEKLGVKSEITK